jgi:hypothetical protein
MKHLKHNFETSETLETQCSPHGHGLLDGDWSGNGEEGGGRGVIAEQEAEQGRRLEGPVRSAIS